MSTSNKTVVWNEPKANSGCPALETDSPLLSVLVPVFNEETTIDVLLKLVDDVPLEKEILVVDDGSTDNTAAVLSGWAEQPNVTLIRHDRNQGKGAAIRSALRIARGQLTIIQDGDLETDPQDYLALVEPILNGTAQAVIGTRFQKMADETDQPPWSACRIGVCLLNLAVRSVYGVRLTDEACCYKVFPTSALKSMELECKRFEFCPEVVAKACRMGLKIAEVPVHYSPRTHQQGKKLRLLRDGLEAMATLWRWRKWKPAAKGRSATCRERPHTGR